MSQYLKPLGVFVGGNLLLLILWLFLPSIGGAGDTLVAATAEHASTFWGWTWVASSLKILVVIFGELVVLYGTARSFLSNKS